MWRRAGHGQPAATPLLLAAVLLAGWAASPCDAQVSYAAPPGSNSILFLNSTLNVRHAHMRRDMFPHICEIFSAAVNRRN